MYVLPTSIIAFAGPELVASGEPVTVAVAVKQLADRDPSATVLVFDAETSRPVELDLRGSVDDVAARIGSQQPPADDSGPSIGPENVEATRADAPADTPVAPRSPGRPKLGVVGREVTLLPRHWEWLAAQPGGASVTLRKLVETARREGVEADRVRRAQEATDRFMLALAGNEPGYEAAARALYAADRAGFETATAGWPRDVRDHARRLAGAAFSEA